jgi:lipopolysaccharide/colanic/teichoic acid biosynthesis glycosyltransferase
MDNTAFGARPAARLWRSPGLKRAADILASAVALAALSAPIALLALVVRVRLGSPVLFRQQRPGLDGKPFGMVKFRTMTDARGPDGALLPDDQRLTAFGRRLRALSLDELPELWNVLRGDMSLVGPRPLLMKYLPLYSPEQARRHEVRPGITGWAQVHGRNGVDWPQRLALDTWYVDHWTHGLDALILLRTLATVVRREGISAAGVETMTEFTGQGADAHGC